VILYLHTCKNYNIYSASSRPDFLAYSVYLQQFHYLLWHVSKDGLLFCGSKMGNLIKWCFTVQRVVEKEVQCCKGAMFAWKWHIYGIVHSFFHAAYRFCVFTSAKEIMFSLICLIGHLSVALFARFLVHLQEILHVNKKNNNNKIFGWMKWNENIKFVILGH